MHCMVYNLKGGIGKTGIALNLALTLDYNFITNEVLSPIEDIFDEGTFLKVGLNDDVPDLRGDHDVIYDFGGYLDARAKKAVRWSDVVIIPTIAESVDLKTTVMAIQEIELYNRNIIIVASKAQKGDLEIVETVMGNNFPDYPVLETKYSRAVPNIFEDGVSVRDQMKNPLKAWSFKDINNQFNLLIKEIEKYGKKD